MVNFPSSQDSFFSIVSHEIPAQHLREFEHAVLNEEKALRLAVKQYIPKSNATPGSGDLTFICSPALGIPKEAYEPFFEDLTRQLAPRNVRIKAFWTADPVQLGGSAVLNRGNIGNDFSWFDHSRDLLQVIQTFRSEMTRPLVGLGHSMGGCQLTWLSLIHPGLFESMVLIDPSILRVEYTVRTGILAKTMLKRREQWDSLEQAAAALKKNPFYSKWDPRVVQKLIANQFVQISEAPSAEIQASLKSGELQPKPGMVATASARHIELNTGFRKRRNNDYWNRIRAIDEKLYESSVDSPIKSMTPWFPSSGITIINFLPFIKCSVMYIVGEKSDFSTPWILEKRMRDTGTGFGGSGGAAKGKVKQHVIKDGGHYDIFDVEREKEIVNVAVEHLVEVHSEFTTKLAEWKKWQNEDPRVQQTGDPDFIHVLEAWSPGKTSRSKMTTKCNAKL